jgi:hypothetical protein
VKRLAKLKDFFLNRYSSRGLRSLFLTVAFAPHTWTLILAFRDLSWVAARSNAWDAIGLVSYGLIFACLESLVIFATAVLLGLPISSKWEEDRRLALLSFLALSVFMWAALGQLTFLLDFTLPEELARILMQSGHPVRYLYAGTLALVFPTVLVPSWFILRSEKILHLIVALTERLALMSAFYLLLDLTALVVVVVRNVS